MIAYVLAAALAAQSGGLVWLLHRESRTSAEERRFLVNHVLAGTPAEFAVLAAAGRPDETVEAVAESRATKPSFPQPLGL